jgi:glucose/arabinose dehydrogenase
MKAILRVVGGFLVIIFVLAGLGYGFKDQIKSRIFSPTTSAIPDGTVTPITNTADQKESAISAEPELVSENIQIPWEIAFLPDGSFLVTERAGSIKRIIQSTQQTIPVQGVAHRGEGGLLGMALHPKFVENKSIYLYLTTQVEGGLQNRVERYTFDSTTNQLTERKVILEAIPGANNHDGGRIAFGPDGYLYITTGDAQTSQAAQDTNSLAGKVLRITDEGDIPSDNPFNNAVYSYGHRNPQGIAWDGQGRLWESEHGPSGPGTGYDEVNLIEKGANYGWPTIQGDAAASGMKMPIIQSGSKETWAPGDLEVVGDTVFFTGLRGEALYSGKIQGTSLTNVSAYFREQYGRLRFVAVGPDGWLYFSTSNTDGRGTPKADDDKILRVKLQALQ